VGRPRENNRQQSHGLCCPADQRPPVVLDFSLGVVSSGKLILARKNGEKIPFGWAVDKEGLPTDDPYEGYEGGGSLTPVGGHKGYGMALVDEMLTALLTDGKWTSVIKSLYEEDESRIQGTCHSFVAVDPDCFVGRDEFKREMDRYITNIKQSAKARNCAEILIPGEPELRTENERLKNGIPMAPGTTSELVALGKSLGISVSLFERAS
jgi:LDH2 family malate/lactate/ureidoglycolate dehydrogenase